MVWLGTAGRSVLVVLSVLLVSLSTEPSAMAGNVTVTDVRELAGLCEAYLQTHTEWFWTAFARIVGENGPDTSVTPLVSEERIPIDAERLHDESVVYEHGRPMFEGHGGTHVYWLLKRLSRRQLH